MSALLELAERCAATAGPDSEISAAIHKLRGFLEWDTYCPHYTASLDAAMTLVPEGFLAMIVNTRDDHGKLAFDAGMALVCSADTIADAEAVYAATMPLALCAAALRARASQEAAK